MNEVFCRVIEKTPKPHFQSCLPVTACCIFTFSVLPCMLPPSPLGHAPFSVSSGLFFFPASRCFAAALMRSRNASPPPFLPPRRFLIPEGYKPCVVASVLLFVVVVAAVIVVVAAAGSSMMVVLALCGAAVLLILGLAVCLCRSLCCVKGERQHPLLEKKEV